MFLLVKALGFGVAVAFIFAGLIGVILPILPGTLMIWLTVLIYALAEGFGAIDWITFTVISIIALTTGTADLWMTLLGARSSGASWQALVLGSVGAIAGLFIVGAIIPVVGTLLGALLGYLTGVLAGQYLRFREWGPALRAVGGGLAGWGVATLVQFGGGLMILFIFVWQVLKA